MGHFGRVNALAVGRIAEHVVLRVLVHVVVDSNVPQFAPRRLIQDIGQVADHNVLQAVRAFYRERRRICE